MFTLAACLLLASLWRPALEPAVAASWVTQPSPRTPFESSLESISCASEAMCFAVGGTPRGVLVERWKGSKWSLERVARVGGKGVALSGVSCFSTRACTAVGNDFDDNLIAERWNGARWSLQIIPTPSTFFDPLVINSVSCPSQSACVAVGTEGTHGALAARWNGARWSLQRTPNRPGARLNAVSCTSSSRCTAVGSYGGPDYSGSEVDNPLVERWDGVRWVVQPTRRLYARIADSGGDFISALDAVWCRPASCVAVGDIQEGYSSQTLIEHWDGSRWAIQDDRTGAESGYALSAISCTSSIWCIAVGTTAYGSLAERWNGTTWRTTFLPSHSGYLKGVSCPAIGSCFAVGSTSDAGAVIKRLR